MSSREIAPQPPSRRAGLKLTKTQHRMLPRRRPRLNQRHRPALRIPARSQQVTIKARVKTSLPNGNLKNPMSMMLIQVNANLASSNLRNLKTMALNASLKSRNLRKRMPMTLTRVSASPASRNLRNLLTMALNASLKSENLRKRGMTLTQVNRSLANRNLRNL